MATVRVLSFTFLFGVLLVQQCICTDAPASSPTPAPESGADVPSQSVTPAPSPSSNLTSPPAPPPSDFPPAPSSVNATSKESPSPAPTPAPNSEVASDISHASTEESKESSGGGMTSGKKAGIAVGVIAAVCFVGLGALVYKKRQQNIQRSQFGTLKRSLVVHDIASLRPSKSIRLLEVEAGGPERMMCTPKDFCNYILQQRRLRILSSDAAALNKLFLEIQSKDENFCYFIDSDNTGRLRNAVRRDLKNFLKDHFKEYLDWEDDMAVPNVPDLDSDTDATFVINSREVHSRGRP
ncbi:hypothetical protein CQW23_14406 [Capsicum baccatum]|uniref:Uncharacterized protein n=1 Tax=Capsicum baccatum TaxID=33114 RepID=A0A2G2WJ23_CAPBA|nr:hypothetical protein CQW23_14406 [Capsicum baccatum]